jgi:hypothetical protein
MSTKRSFEMFDRRLYIISPPGILHPSQVPFGVPFDYASGFYEETYNPTQGTGFIAADGLGRCIGFWPPGQPGDSVVAQQLFSIEPTANLRSLFAARFLLDHPADTDALIGMWGTESDPFGSGNSLNIADGLLFYNVAATFFGELYAICISQGSAPDPIFLFETSEATYYDVALILHPDSVAEFLTLTPDAQWVSTLEIEHVPTVAMRPSFAARRSAALGGLVIRSSHTQEQIIP